VEPLVLPRPTSSVFIMIEMGWNTVNDIFFLALWEKEGGRERTIPSYVFLMIANPLEGEKRIIFWLQRIRAIWIGLCMSNMYQILRTSKRAF
jgi:hypothetical protein